jgi:hypothetical protein
MSRKCELCPESVLDITAVRQAGDGAGNGRNRSEVHGSATGPQVQSQTSLQTQNLSKNVSIQCFRRDLSFAKFKHELNMNMFQIQGLAVAQTQPQVHLRLNNY